jgi:ADP-ribose pyrophosphatase
MKTFETLSRRLVLDLGPRLRVESRRVKAPDGRIIDDWPWIVSRDYVIVLARMRDRKFLVFRQTKYALDGESSLAPVGGYIEAEEPPLEAARRELLEETGCQAAAWQSLGSFRVDGNNASAAAHFFVAEGAVKTTEPHSDDLEEQEVLYLDGEELKAAVLGGQFKVLAWSAAVSLALLGVAGT